jgi:hypothetical protein
MPDQYEEIKESYLARGKDEKDAKRIASMTFIKKGKGGTRSSRAKSLHSDKPVPFKKLKGGAK